MSSPGPTKEGRVSDVWDENVHCARSPALPRLVKIWITPAVASVPYSVDAAEPLMTSMRSMSLGLID